MAISDQITRLRNKIEEQRDLIAELSVIINHHRIKLYVYII
jgi:uncharacterized coiled-coil protein SlyX